MEQNKHTTALLVMDMQSWILSRIPDATKVISNVSRAIAKARNNGIPVIYVVVGYRKGAPELNSNNKNKEVIAAANMEEMIKIHPDVLPLADEITVVKRRVSAFTGSDLEVILRTFGIQHLVLTGIATSGVVLSTLTEAADKDYDLTVLADCCADIDEEVHHVLTTKYFPRRGEVLTSDEWNIS
jgi:nicotinamidase-related amidase